MAGTADRDSTDSSVVADQVQRLGEPPVPGPQAHETRRKRHVELDVSEADGGQAVAPLGRGNETERRSVGPAYESGQARVGEVIADTRPPRSHDADLPGGTCLQRPWWSLPRLGPVIPRRCLMTTTVGRCRIVSRDLPAAYCLRHTVSGSPVQRRRHLGQDLGCVAGFALAAAAAAVETGSTGHGSGSAVAELLAPDIGGWVELPAFAQVTGHLSPFSGCITSRTGPLPKCRLHPWRDVADP